MKILKADLEGDGLLPELTKLHCIVIEEAGVFDVYTSGPVYRTVFEDRLVEHQQLVPNPAWDEYADEPTEEPYLTVPVEVMERVQVADELFPTKPILEGLERLASADRIVFHNALRYDIWAIRKLYPQIEIKVDRVIDTLLLSRMLDPENRQHSLAVHGTRLGQEKQGHDDWSVLTYDMVTRCVSDVEILGTLFAEQMARIKAEGITREAIIREHRVNIPLAIQEQHGFCLDVEELDALEFELVEEQAQVAQRLAIKYPPRWFPTRPVSRSNWGSAKYRKWPISGHPLRTAKGAIRKGPYTDDAPFIGVEFETFNPGSNQHIERRLRWDHGWTPTELTKGGAAKIDAEVLAELAIEFPDTAELARYARCQKLLGQIRNWRTHARKHPDGTVRVHGGITSIGTRTLRMAHMSPNMAQVDKKEARMREVWKPTPGRVLVGVDAEGLQERIIAGGCAEHGDDEKVYVRACVEGDKTLGTDTHSLTQKALGFPTRDGSKTFKYAKYFGASPRRLGSTVIREHLDNGLPVPEGGAVKLGKEYSDKFAKNIPGFDGLITHLETEASETGYVPLVGGYRAGIPMSSYPDRKTGRPQRDVRLALNTYAMGIESVVMKEALVIFHFEKAANYAHQFAHAEKTVADFKQTLVSSDFLTTNGFCYVANVHDEVQIEADPEIAETIATLFKDSIREAGERLGLKCPQAGSSSIGQNWKETH